MKHLSCYITCSKACRARSSLDFIAFASIVSMTERALSGWSFIYDSTSVSKYDIFLSVHDAVINKISRRKQWFSFIMVFIIPCKLLFFTDNFVFLLTIELNIDNISAPVVTVRNSNFTIRLIGRQVALYPPVRSILSISQAIAGLERCGMFPHFFFLHIGKGTILYKV